MIRILLRFVKVSAEKRGSKIHQGGSVIIFHFIEALYNLIMIPLFILYSYYPEIFRLRALSFLVNTAYTFIIYHSIHRNTELLNMKENNGSEVGLYVLFSRGNQCNNY